MLKSGLLLFLCSSIIFQSLFRTMNNVKYLFTNFGIYIIQNIYCSMTYIYLKYWGSLVFTGWFGFEHRFQANRPFRFVLYANGTKPTNLLKPNQPWLVRLAGLGHGPTYSFVPMSFLNFYMALRIFQLSSTLFLRIKFMHMLYTNRKRTCIYRFGFRRFYMC